MKEQIMVFSKEWFKKHNKTLCWFANAPIIKYWFRWLLRIHKDIPWNEKIEEIMPNAFTYGKKLVLVDCVKLKNGEEVFNCSKKLHRKLKNKGLLVKRLRHQQTTDFRTHDKFSKRLYYGLKPLWYLMHFMDWAMLDRCEELTKLSFGFSTLTFYPDAGTGNTTVDGSVYHSVSTADASWATLRNGAGKGAEPTTSQGPYCYIAGGPSGWQWLYRSIFLFDTSSLTSSATISNAVLSLYSDSKADRLNINPNIDIYTSTPSSNNNLQASDFTKIGTISQTGSPISYGNWGDRYNDFTFNATGRGNVSKTGISKFGARNANYDVSGSTPPTSNGYSSLYGYFADQTGTTRDPKLVITGTGGGFPSAPTVTTQAATDIATTSFTGNGNITDTGGENCTRRGFCYKVGTSGDPTTSDSVAYDDGSFGTGTYSKSITGLTAGTNYRVRAYAVNSAGTSYGTTVQVTTLKAFKPRTMWFN